MIPTCFRKSLGPALVAAGLSLAGASAANSAELTVTVSGIDANAGEIGCALYKGPDGFPMDDSVATTHWQNATDAGVECRFDGLEPGDYAVAVSHDFNGNRETDTNFFGIPTEPWGVSNNVRPTLRAPRFEEAAVQVRPGTAVSITVEVAE